MILDDLQRGTRKAVVAPVLIILHLFILSACSGSGQDAASTGSLAFKATWPTISTDGTTPRATTTEGVPDVCTSFGIATISAVVLDEDGTQKGSGSWACDIEGHRGTIDELPVGSGYRVVVAGLVDDVVRWRGEVGDIAIEANGTTIADNIIMSYLDHLLTATASDGGHIEPAGRVAVAAEGEQAFAFAADSEYEIADVLVDGVSQGAIEGYVFSDLSADHTIYVSFLPKGAAPPTHIVSASAGGGGEIVPAGDITVVAGNDQNFEIVAATGNSIVEVLVDGTSQGAISSYTFSHVAADHTIQVVFDATTYTINALAGTGGGHRSGRR